MTAMHRAVEWASDIWNQKWPIKSFEHPKHWKWLSVLCRGVRCSFSCRSGTGTLTAAGDVFLVQTHSFVVWERLAHEVTQVSGPSCCMHAHRGVWTARLFLSDVVTVLLLLVSRIFTSKGLFWLKYAREGNGDSPFFVFHSHLSSRKTLGNCLTGTKRMEKINQ